MMDINDNHQYSTVEEYIDIVCFTEEDQFYKNNILQATNIKQFRQLIPHVVDVLNKVYTIPLETDKILNFVRVKSSIKNAQKIIGREAISWFNDDFSKICSIKAENISLLTPIQVLCLMTSIKNVWVEKEPLPKVGQHK